jgi:carbon starvation protein
VIINTGRARHAWVTLVPLAWLVVVTLTAGWQKLMSPNPALGFLAKASALGSALASGSLPAGRTAADMRRMIFNERLDAAVAAAFMLAVVIVLVASIAEWTAVLRGRRVAKSTEVPAEYGVAMAGD